MSEHDAIIGRREFTGALLAGAIQEARVEAEEVVYEFEPADNGAGPLWAYGASGVVRSGDTVFATGLETIPGAKPLNNCRWALYRRDDQGWRRVWADEKERQREPCPIALVGDGRLVVSTNPTITPPDTYNGLADPHLLVFSTRDFRKAPQVLRPVWSGEPRLSEHTYRGLGVDTKNRELVVLHNDGRGTPNAHWAYLNGAGAWRGSGVITYPIRGCYPQVALRNRVAHVMAVGDIVEPVAEWRKWKFEQTRREWDYVFRRLFYVVNPDVAGGQFGEVLEVANVDRTAGHITNLDLWLAPDGAAHLLYLERSVASAALRDRFFAGVPLTASLEHCVIRNGQVAARRTLVKGGEGAGRLTPAYARFHSTGKGRLLVLASLRDGAEFETRLYDVSAAGSPAPVSVPLRYPFVNFLTATERGGSAPSNVIDVIGITAGQPRTIRYARIRVAG